MSSPAFLQRLEPRNCLLVICDIQDKFRGRVQPQWRWEQMTTSANSLIEAARLLDIPIMATEQYPQGLGPTAEEVKANLVETEIFEKREFSLFKGDLKSSVLSKGRSQIIMCGLESHVCVQQSCFDLLQNQHEGGLVQSLHIATDAVCSQRESDREAALALLASSGAICTTTESILFELVRDGGKDHPSFKDMSSIAKARAARLAAVMEGGLGVDAQ